MIIKKSYFKSVFALVISILLIMQCIVISPTLIYAGNIETDSTNTYQYTFANNKATIVKYLGAQNPTINIPDKVDGVVVSAIGEEVFLDCTWLKKLILPNTLNNIGVSAFENIGVTEITIPGSVSNINGMAFYGCKSLKTIYILYGIQTIGDGAFADCTALDTIAIARSIKDMGSGVLRGNTSIIEADSDSYAGGKYVPAGATVTKSELPADSPVPYEYDIADDGSVIIKSYQGSNVNPEIPNDINGKPVKHIGDNAFNNEKGHNVETIKLPDSLLTIGSNAFAGTKLTFAIIPDSVTDIGDKAFDDTENLILNGSCDALDKYLVNMHNIKFKPYGPGTKLYYRLTLGSPSTGNILGARHSEYKRGTVIPIEARPKPGYGFVVWIKSGEGNFEDVNERVTNFTMPNSNTYISTSFNPLDLFIEHGVVRAYNITTPLTIPDTWEYEKFIDTRQVPTTRIQSISNEYYNSYGISNGGPTKLEIPATIATIDDGVFYTKCGNLTDITVASNNQNYSSENGVLFNKNKTRLIRYPSKKQGTRYVIPNSVTSVDPYAFYDCDNLTSIVIGDNVTSVDEKTFANCDGLIDITIGNSVISIGANAFDGCNALTSITIENNIGIIGSSAFANCNSLTTVIIGNNVTSIGANAFEDCNALINITIGNNVTSIGANAFRNCDSLRTITIPDNVTSIGDYAFEGCNALTNITIGTDTSSNIVNIGEYAFANCTSLTDISMGNNVKSISSNMFYNCDSLESVLIPNSITSIGSNAFASCISLKTIIIPDNVTNIGDSAFLGCTSLTDIPIGNNITRIGNSVFKGCTSLKSIVIPDKVTSIGDSAFANCSGLTNITIGNGVTTIGSNAFTGCNALTSVTIENNIDIIGSGAFANCNALTTIIIGDKVTSIGNNAFEGCNVLTNITIGRNVKTIGSSAFKNCDNLETVTIPNNVITIGESAFGDCDDLTSILIGNKVSNIGLKVFYGCDKLTNINVDSSNVNYMDSDGVLYNKDQSVLLVYPMNKLGNTYTMPNSLKTIQSYAFANSYNLVNINIPNGVTTVGSNAFENCSSLTDISISKSVSNFSLTALYKCTNLKSIIVDSENTNYFGDGIALYNANKTEIMMYAVAAPALEYEIISTVTTISNNAFLGCKNLGKIILPANLTTIGSHAFEGCINLTNIDIPATILSIKLNAFKDCNSLVEAIIRAPKGQDLRMENDIFASTSNLTIKGYLESSSETYATRYDINFVPLDEFTEGLIVVDGVLVGYIGTDTDIILSNDIHTIGNEAFSDPDNKGKDVVITSVSMPLSVTTFKEYAFKDCISLNKIVIPKSVTNIAKNAFKGCKDLEEIKVLSTGNTTYSDIDGVLTDKYKTTIKEVPDAFKGVNKDGKYTIPSSITHIESSAFADCTSLTDITIEDITYLPVNAFKGAFVEPAKININLLGDIKDISNGVFANCTGITSIDIPSTVERIGDGVFEGCTNLTDINIVQGNINAVFVSEDGVLFTNEYNTETEFGKQLVIYPEGKVQENYDIPNGTLSIYKNAFKNCTHLKNIIIPNSVVTIENNAFDSCTFTNITIPAGVETIGAYAFAKNNSIIGIELPNTVSTVRQGAFTNCSKFITAKIYRNDIDLQGQVFDEKELNGKPFVTINAFAGSNGYLYTTTHNNIGFTELLPSGMQLDPNGVVGENINLTVTSDTNKHAQANVTEEQFTSAMRNAVTSLKETINVNISTVSEMVYSIDTTMPKNSITLIAKDTKVNDLAINTPVANIKLAKTVLDIISTNAVNNSITVSAKMVDILTLPEDVRSQVKENTVFKLSVSSGGNEITGFGVDKISVSLPYTLSEDETADNIKLYYLNDIGELIPVNSSYSSGYVSFDTDTFDNMYVIK